MTKKNKRFKGLLGFFWPYFFATDNNVDLRYGFDTRFQTGTDEHGLKIEQAATAVGKKPIELCDQYAAAMRGLADRLNCSYDKYIRTSDAVNHYPVCQELWRKCKANGDIYLGKYEGWYMVREERHVPDAEAEQLGFKDPVNQKPLDRISEDNFMLKTSAYRFVSEKFSPLSCLTGPRESCCIRHAPKRLEGVLSTA